ncbi:MAG: ArsR/SmtB family transcription factor [Candidatus Muiribacteriaceae bacterium]
MKKLTPDYQARADIFKALGHPTRLFIVEMLGDSEKCVQELTDMIGCDMSTVSRHLSVLKNCGIIQSEKNRNYIYYSLKIKCLNNFFACVNEVITHK